RFCQLVETETRNRRTGIPLWFYLALRQPTWCPSSQPNSRIVSSSRGGNRTQTTDAVAVGSVGRWSIRRQKTLGMPGRFEALHAPLALTRRPMRVFTPVIEVATLTMFDPRQNLALCGAVAL